MDISSAIFHSSSPDLGSCPDESLPEFAFIGRSNVGKSSLLNMLAGRDGLARVSPTPGFTKLINIFTMNKTWRLVDLPGYGFTQGSRRARRKFNRAVNEYLQHRTNLCCVFALIDSGLPPQEMDVEFLEWLVRRSVPFVIVFTKIDAVSATVARGNMEAFMGRIAGWFEQPPALFSCSAKTGRGRRQLLGVIGEAMAAIQSEAKTESVEPPQGAGLLPKDLPATGPKARVRDTRKGRPDIVRPW